MEAEDAKRRFDMLMSEKTNINSTLEVIEKYIVPFRGNFFDTNEGEESVEWRKRDLYDSTAVESAQTLSSSLQGSLTSASVKWFALRFRDDELNDDDEAKEWLEMVEDKIYDSLNDSNFDLETSEMYLDIVSYGTSIITEEEDGIEDDGVWGGLDFSAIPMQDCAFEEDAKRKLISFYRQYDWTPAQIYSKFGDETPENIIELMKNAQKASEKIKVVFIVYKENKNKDADTSGVLTAEKRPYQYRYMLHKEAKYIGKHGGYYEMPAFVVRWRKTSNSKWGYSPAMVCLSDVLTLNELCQATLEALGKVVDPATLTTERGLLSDLDLGRGGLTVVRNIGDVVPYESKARFDVGDMKIERLQYAIRRAFHVDQLQLKDTPAMTATEVQVRYELMQRLLGPTLGRIKNDFLDPLIVRTLNILMRNRQLPEIPMIVKQRKGELDVQYVGPLPRSQKMQTADSIRRWVGDIAGLAEAIPNLLDLPDEDAIGRGLATLQGVPAKFIRDKKDVKAIRENRAKEQQLADSMAKLQSASESAVNMSKARGMNNEQQQ